MCKSIMKSFHHVQEVVDCHVSIDPSIYPFVRSFIHSIIQSFNHLAKLANRVGFVVRANELKVLHRRHRHAAVEVEAIVTVGKCRLPCLQRKHVSMPALFHVRQLRQVGNDIHWEEGVCTWMGAVEGEREGGRERRSYNLSTLNDTWTCLSICKQLIVGCQAEVLYGTDVRARSARWGEEEERGTYSGTSSISQPCYRQLN